MDARFLPNQFTSCNLPPCSTPLWFYTRHFQRDHFHFLSRAFDYLFQLHNFKFGDARTGVWRRLRERITFMKICSFGVSPLHCHVLFSNFRNFTLQQLSSSTFLFSPTHVSCYTWHFRRNMLCFVHFFVLCLESFELALQNNSKHFVAFPAYSPHPRFVLLPY